MTEQTPESVPADPNDPNAPSPTIGELEEQAAEERRRALENDRA